MRQLRMSHQMKADQIPFTSLFRATFYSHIGNLKCNNVVDKSTRPKAVTEIREMDRVCLCMSTWACAVFAEPKSIGHKLDHLTTDDDKGRSILATWMMFCAFTTWLSCIEM